MVRAATLKAGAVAFMVDSFRWRRPSQPTDFTFSGALAGGSIAAAGLNPPLRGGHILGKWPWELQFATNHLGHFALAWALHDALARGARDRGAARIVSLSSTAHMRAPVDFADIHFERRAYDPQIAYAQSKTANSLFAVEATRLWGDNGIVANAVNPGGVRTGLQRNFTQRQRESLDAAEACGVFTWKTIGQGAATTLVAAVAPELEQTGGHYLDDCREAYTVPNDSDLSAHSHGVKEWALDPDAARELWAVSLQTLNP
jgi:NAD(P)-dependent dehydrogenase (short-subunit alcohol dehydrogenase family)